MHTPKIALKFTVQQLESIYLADSLKELLNDSEFPIPKIRDNKWFQFTGLESYDDVAHILDNLYRPLEMLVAKTGGGIEGIELFWQAGGVQRRTTVSFKL